MNGQVRTQEPCGCVQSVIVPTGIVKRKFVIYKATNKTNGKIYIGQTAISLADRKVGHIQKVNSGSRSYFHNAIRGQGIDAFVWEAICLCFSKDEANAKECEFIKVFNTKAPTGYNITDGGEGTVGFYPSEATRAKMSKAHKGNHSNLGCKQSDETKAKVSKAMMGNTHCLGYKHSDEFKAKVREIMTGNKHMLGYKMPEETKVKISKGMTGKKNCLGYKPSDEHRAKVSKALKGRRLSDETRARMSESMKGRKKTDEHRAKLVKAWIIRRQKLNANRIFDLLP